MDRCKPRKDYECMPMHECMPSYESTPASGRKCIGTYSMKYRVYEGCDCEYKICRLCAYCGCEYDDEQDECPMCGAPSNLGSMSDDNPGGDPDGDPDGFGGSWRRRFRSFPRFRFFPPFFPFFFLFRRRRWF